MKFTEHWLQGPSKKSELETQSNFITLCHHHSRISINRNLKLNSNMTNSLLIEWLMPLGPFSNFHLVDHSHR
jgi:hypothetical protein